MVSLAEGLMRKIVDLVFKGSIPLRHIIWRGTQFGLRGQSAKLLDVGSNPICAFNYLSI